MGKPTKCVYGDCSSENVICIGPAIEDGLMGDFYAYEGWMCLDCHTAWKYEGEVEIVADYDTFEVIESDPAERS